MTAYKLKLSGLDEWQGAISALQAKAPKALAVAFKESADIVVDAARPQIPSRSGKARASLKVKANPAGASIVAGGSSAPYFPWLDYGGRVGRRKKTKRRFFREGRYIWPTFRERGDEVREVLIDALRNLARSEGIEVSSGG